MSLQNAFFSSVLIAVVMTLSLRAYSQQETCPCPVRDSNDSQSLADIAKEAKQGKTGHARKSITDDDIVSKKGPLPRLNTEDADNSDEIIEAIGKFKDKHNEQETERAIHDWYDEYDEMLTAAIREQRAPRAARIYLLPRL